MNEQKLEENAERISAKIKGKRVYILGMLIAQMLVFPMLVFSKKLFSAELYYGAILLCLISSVVFLHKNKQSALQVMALVFTCFADFFLILLGSHKLLAMCFFLTTQICYAVRTVLMAKNARERVVNIAVRLLGSFLITLIAVLVLQEKTDALIVVSLIYYVNLLVSITFAFLHFQENKLLAIGLLLFALCDVFIGLPFVIDIFSLTSEHFIYKLVHGSPIRLDCMFYQPSQVLLCLSAGGVKIWRKNA